MKNIAASIAIIFLMIACSKVPITNRRQTKLVSESNLITMAEEQYAAFMAEADVLPESDPKAQRVKRIGIEIQKATEDFLNRKGHGERLEGFQWKFNTVNDPTINAWCMPGGMVCVYTGILDLVETDDELAVIMGHEIAHAIARHGNERMSQQMLIGGVGRVLAPSDSTQVSIFHQVFMGGATLGMLKYSREHETESDKLGLVFMKLAGYDPNAGITFWRKMSAAGGQRPPEILSTHPSGETRIEDMKEFIPTIDEYTK